MQAADLQVEDEEKEIFLVEVNRGQVKVEDAANYAGNCA